MTRRVRTSIPSPTVLPRPAEAYDRFYMNNLVKALQGALDEGSNPSVLRGGELFLSNMPTRGAGLPAGSVFEDSGVLKIVRPNDVYADTYLIGVRLGTVSTTP